VFVQKVTLQTVLPPDKVQAAFDDAVRAGQDRERLKNEGQAYANEVVPRARGMASRLLEEAQGYATEVVQKAEGDAARFRSVLVEYQKAPNVTRDRLYLDMMRSVLGTTPKVVMDQRGGGGNLLYLPLDKLIQGSGVVPPVTEAPAVAAPPRAPADVPPQAEPARSREALRSRER
jgi:membrane protease subunit HflK